MQRTDTPPQVLITRTFDAPRESVFHAFSNVESLRRWYAPHGCEIHFRMLDFRVGGAFQSCIKIPGGKECWCRGVYLEIQKPERIVYTMAMCDKDGTLTDPRELGMDPEWPAETKVTLTFAEAAGKTLLTLHQTVSESLARKTGAHPSWLMMFDKLAEDLKVLRS
jgi:uncharacterized protein YndB with AHSA1/START domain